jgi:hypothetical protein
VGPKTYGRGEDQAFYFRSVGKTTHIKMAETHGISVKVNNESQLKLIISDNVCIQISNKMQQQYLGFIARSLYMFPALSAPIIRSKITAVGSHWYNMLPWIVMMGAESARNM